MIKRLLLASALLLAYVLPAHANQKYSGKCSASGAVTTAGLNSTNTADITYASATVTVNIVGGGLATLFSDSGGTPLANPFTANSDSTFGFYAANGHYTAVCSGTGVPTITVSDILLNDPSVATSFTGNFFSSTTANPAASGIFRAASLDIGLCWRNNANSADICFTKNSSDTVNLNTNATIAGTLGLGANAITAAGLFSSTANAALTGTNRFASTDTFKIRNNANSADLNLLSKNASDQVQVGDTAGIVTTGQINAGSNQIIGGLAAFTGVANSGNETITGTLTVNGAATFNSPITMGGLTVSSLNNTGNEVIGGTLSVTGNVVSDLNLTTHALTAGSVNQIVYVSSSSTDIGASINTALTSFGAAPACGTIILPRGTFNASTTANFTNREGCIMKGQGDGQASTSASTAIKWTGTSGSTMLTISSVRWSSFSDFMLDGNSLAGRAIDLTAVNAVAATQQVHITQVAIKGVTQSPAQNVHVGSSTNDQISESTLNVTHLNCTTCVFQEGSQTLDITYDRELLSGYSTFGYDFEAGSALLILPNTENTVSTGISIHLQDASILSDITLVHWYDEELACTNVALSAPTVAGGRHSNTTLVGGAIQTTCATPASVLFDFEHQSDLAINGTRFKSNAPGQGGTIKFSVTGGTPNNVQFNGTLQNSWALASLGSNSTMAYTHGAACGPGTTTCMQFRNFGLDIWGGSLQFADTTGVAKYRFQFNSSEMRSLDGSNNILGGWLGAGTATTGATPWKANHFKADTGITIASGTELTGQTGTGSNIVTDTSPTIGGTPNIGRVKTTGSAPTSCAVTGAGASGACAVIASSSDSFALLQIQAAGAGPAATGTLSMTFSASLGGARAVCVAFPSNTSSGSWQTTGVQFTTTGGTNTGPTFNWSNNAVALTAASNYNVGVLCFGQ